MDRLAFYDMDKTITREPTWTRFLIHAARARGSWRLGLLPLAGIASLGYLLRLTDRAGLKQATHRLLIGRSLAPDTLAQIADAFADTVVERGIFEGARARIAADRAAGYRLVLATASHRYYAAAIARRLGFDDVVATEARRGRDGHILSLIEGENCYGPEKLRLIEKWMAEQRIARTDVTIRAYSDHVSDAPLLGWADEGFAVNPHPPLRAMALGRGWPVLDWSEEAAG